MSGANELLLAEVAILVYFLAINTTYLALTLIAVFDLISYRFRFGRRSLRSLLIDHNYQPVSILVPAYNEAETVVENVRSLLVLGYPEFEIILINDGSDDETLERLRRAFSLFPVPVAMRSDLPTGPLRRAYLSLDHPNLKVLDKERGGKSDALNAGLNVSTYGLFCTIDADSLLETDALLRIAHIFSEDGRVVAAGGIVRVLNDAVVAHGRVVEARSATRPLLLSQAQEYVRGFLAGRSSLARLNSLLIIAGAFGLFRRRSVVEVGGFSDDTVCEDMELVARLHRHSRENRLGWKVNFVPDPVCWTQVPADWVSLIRQRDRWQRGLIESLWKHRRMFLNPRYGSIGLLAMPFYTLFEAIGPLVEIAGYGFVLFLLATGRLETPFALLFFLLAVVYGLLLSIAALNLDALLFRRYERARDLAWMMAGTLIEFCGYRQILAAVRAFGFVTVFTRRQQWGRIRRTRIEETVAPAPQPLRGE